MYRDEKMYVNLNYKKKESNLFHKIITTAKVLAFYVIQFYMNKPPEAYPPLFKCVFLEILIKQFALHNRGGGGATFQAPYLPGRVGGGWDSWLNF